MARLKEIDLGSASTLFLDNYADDNDYTYIGEVSQGSERWEENVWVVFKYSKDNNYYAFEAERGLTELQEDTIGYEELDSSNHETMVSVFKVESYEKTIFAWRKI